MKIIKRDGREVEFDQDKICIAVEKAAKSVNEEVDSKEISAKVTKRLENNSTVEGVQDLVEFELMKVNPKTAKAYILYREEKAKERTKKWDMTDLQRDILDNKYRDSGESFDGFIDRVAGNNPDVAKMIRNKDFLYAGRILAGRGISRNVSLSNCYVLPQPDDNIESIYDVARAMALTYSYCGGTGTDLSRLRPAGALVNNAAKTSVGPVPFMQLYDTTTKIIGQEGRRGALMLTISSDHPNARDFIEAKQDVDAITHANISVRAKKDLFDNSEENNKTLKMIAEANWRTGEPGLLYWDRVEDWHLLSHHPEYELHSTNPCGEQPLPEYGSCNLGSINLGNFVLNPFTDDAEIDTPRLLEAVKTGVVAMNEALDDGMELHPLPEQREVAAKFRQIGLGIMGLADMYIKLGVRYGSEESLEIAEFLAKRVRNTAFEESVDLVDRYGTYPAYDFDVIKKSNYFKDLPKNLQEKIREKGMANSHVLSIAPTGSISTMIGVSGGIEPIFANSFTRTTKSLSGKGDVDYKVFTEVIKELMDVKGIEHERDLPDYCTTSHDLNPEERIEMQSIWQTYIDSAISSTLNLDNSVTVEEIEKIYRLGYEKGLKGITVFRDGSFREGILNVDKEEEQEYEQACPECKGQLIMQEGCNTCVDCGWSACSF